MTLRLYDVEIPDHEVKLSWGRNTYNVPAGRFQVRAAASDDARVDAARLAHRAAGDRVIPPYRALVAQTAAAAHRPTLAASEQALEAIRRTTRG